MSLRPSVMGNFLAFVVVPKIFDFLARFLEPRVEIRTVRGDWLALTFVRAVRVFFLVEPLGLTLRALIFRLPTTFVVLLRLRLLTFMVLSTLPTCFFPGLTKGLVLGLAPRRSGEL